MLAFATDAPSDLPDFQHYNEGPAEKRVGHIKQSVQDCSIWYKSTLMARALI